MNTSDDQKQFSVIYKKITGTQNTWKAFPDVIISLVSPSISWFSGRNKRCLVYVQKYCSMWHQLVLYSHQQGVFMKHNAQASAMWGDRVKVNG